MDKSKYKQVLEQEHEALCSKLKHTGRENCPSQIDDINITITTALTASTRKYTYKGNNTTLSI